MIYLVSHVQEVLLGNLAALQSFASLKVVGGKEKQTIKPSHSTKMYLYSKTKLLFPVKHAVRLNPHLNVSYLSEQVFLRGRVKDVRYL